MLMSSHFHCSDHPYRPGGHMCCTPPRRGMEIRQLAVASAPTWRQTWPKHGHSFRPLTRCLQSKQSQVVGALWIFHFNDLCPGRHRRILLRLFRCEVQSVGRKPGLLFCQKLALPFPASCATSVDLHSSVLPPGHGFARLVALDVLLSLISLTGAFVFTGDHALHATAFSQTISLST